MARTTPGRRFNSDARIIDNATITATYDKALTMKQVATPRVRIRTPPMAGPITRAEFMSTLLRLTALGKRSLPTISKTKVWRAGLSNRLTTPRPVASAKTCQISMLWVTTRSPKIRARMPAEAWVQ